MFATSRIAKFVGSLLLFYALLAAPWPRVAPTYATLFRFAGNSASGALGSGATIHFGVPANHTGGADVLISLKTPWHSQPLATELSSRLTGFLPTAQVAALVLATPIPWYRRLRALFWAVLLVNCFLAARVACVVYVLYSMAAPPALLPGPILADLVSIVASPTPAFLVPPIAWLVITFRSEDLQSALGNLPRRGSS